VAETLSPALPPDVEARAHAVLERACARRLTLSTAESCTGGLLASLLTDVQGYGHAFERGFVVYSERAKRDLLGVSAALLEKEGAVSEAAARAMAEGGLAASSADLCIAITGYAGPGGPDVEPGRVHIAVALRGAHTRHQGAHFPASNRGAVRIEALRLALSLLQDTLDGQ
jgi:nicotinamide-nucleotide amidase